MCPVFRVFAVTISLCFIHALCVPAIADENKDSDVLATLLENGGVYVGTDVCKECHEDHFKQIIRTKHGQKADSRTRFASQGCESCHGPGEYHSMYPETGGLISFTGKNVSPLEAQNGICLECHQRDRHLLSWFTSNHEAENMACVNCHLVHKPSKVLERTKQSKVCYRCHKNIRAQTYQTSTHPIRENMLVCSDCHNPHGSNGPNQLKQYSINDNCYSCHAEKRGPFLWEHYPVIEDCTLCHRVHGSNHPALLVKQGPQLCQACHADISIRGFAEGAAHTSRMFEFSNSTSESRMIVGRNCANCHSQVHGSNHPSGANLLR